MVSVLQNGLNEYFDKVIALRALFEASDGAVSRRGFEVFADRILRDQKAILALAWIPRVSRDQRAAHELAAARDGLSDYHIRSVAEDGSVAISPEEDEYYPVYYTTEKRPSPTVYGLNMRDGGRREQALAQSRDGNKLIASETLILQSGIGDRHGFFVVLPAYGEGPQHDTVGEQATKSHWLCSRRIPNKYDGGHDPRRHQDPSRPLHLCSKRR